MLRKTNSFTYLSDIGEPMPIIEQNSLAGYYRNVPTRVQIAVLGDLGVSDDLYGVLADMTAKYGIDYGEIISKLIECESGGQENAIGDNGQSRGILQFQKKTFDHFCEGEWLNSEDQIRCAVKLINKGRGPAEWVNCWNKLNLN